MNMGLTIDNLHDKLTKYKSVDVKSQALLQFTASEIMKVMPLIESNLEEIFILIKKNYNENVLNNLIARDFGSQISHDPKVLERKLNVISACAEHQMKEIE